MQSGSEKARPDFSVPIWALLLAGMILPAGGAERPPNILFILADQWRAQAFGFAGDPNVRTPNLDRLQRESVCFLNAIAGVPVCCPARASLLTGQRALTHGVFLNDVPLAPGAMTLAKVLSGAGYDTAYIGKWHLNGDGRSAFIPRERRQGFDYWKALECTHDYNHSFYYGDGPEKLMWQGYDAAAQTGDARQYLRNHASADKPFFLFLSWGPPHDPYQTAPRRYQEMYVAEKMQLRANVPEALAPRVRNALAGYYAHCTALDEGVGALLETLQETRLADNTLVIFTADHGDLLGSHGAFNKQQPYDESIRVPLLMRCPAGIGQGGKLLRALISQEDLMPTILRLCRLKVPKSVEGLDYSHYVRGGKDPSDGSALISCVAPFGQWERRHGGREYRGLRTARYTYVRDRNGPWLLFDNEADPCQLVNLANRPEHSAMQAELDRRLRRKLRQNGDKFLAGEAYIRQWGYHVNETGTVPYTP